MRTKRLLTAVLIASFAAPLPAFADINGNEAELLAIINSTREYNGVLYQVAQNYRDAARAYLDDPTVDCTDEQKQKAINQMFGSIQQGIDEGYLIAVGGGAASGETSGGSSDVKADITAQAAENVPGGAPDNGAAGVPAETAADHAAGATSAASQPEPAGNPDAGGAAAAVGATDAADSTAANAEQVSGSTAAENAGELAQAETAPQETEPSPIVLALEQAMNAPQEVSAAMEPGSLLPEVIYPSQFVSVFALAAVAAALIAAAASFYFGLFHHHHKKRQKQ